MASFWSLLAMFMVLFMTRFASASLSSQIHVQLSTISAAPAFLPDAPVSSPPALSPDFEPLFPTPKAEAPSPSDSSLPTIPSSPSPPNPDNILSTPGPESAISPSRALPVSSSVSLTPSGLLRFTPLLALTVFSLVQACGL